MTGIYLVENYFKLFFRAVSFGIYKGITLQMRFSNTLICKALNNLYL